MSNAETEAFSKGRAHGCNAFSVRADCPFDGDTAEQQAAWQAGFSEGRHALQEMALPELVLI
jgi:hypothetical protein